MPCRSYEDDHHYNNGEFKKVKDNADKLARISCLSLTAIEQLYTLMMNDQKDGVRIGEVLRSVLENPEVVTWWRAHKIADAAEQKRLKDAKETKESVTEQKRKRAELIANMSEEDRKILGLK
jgi:hypothetical protein